MLSKVDLEEKNLISQRTPAVYDPEFTKALTGLPWAEWMEKSPPFDCRLEYLQTLDAWIHSTRLNSVTGLDRFSEKDLINGTTQGFDEFYFRYANKRLRFFRGEYAYHRRVSRHWKFLDDEALSKDDAIIISWPFCSTGAEHPLMQSVLSEAQKLGVPVLIDAAYFGTCHQQNFDFSHPAIEAVCFSLTKGLGLGNIRSGMRYSNYQESDPIRQQNQFNHTILSTAKIGLYMMQKFSADYIPEKYAAIQKEVCADAGLTPTPCMHIALASGEEWVQYKIDELYYRVGIRELVKARRKKLI